MYLLISGYPPFNGNTREEIINKIQKCELRFDDPVWYTVSPDCKQLIIQLLEPNISKRLSASEALKNKWLTSYKCPVTISNTDLRMSLQNLKKFRAQMMFQKLVLAFITTRFVPQKMEDKIKRIFNFFDKNGDGQISKVELEEGYKKLYGSTKKMDKEVRHILSRVTLNKNGNIGYNGIFFKFS